MDLRLIVEWADTKRMQVKEFKTETALIEFMALAQMLGAKICVNIGGDWVWS